jgi:NAD(P)-dependent dehydrogenase (short-subunit alcohol dehydrogenase family)
MAGRLHNRTQGPILTSSSQSIKGEIVTTAQAPLGSGFGMRSSAADVMAGIDLTGRTAIVTGGYSGIGVATTRALAAAGAQVTVPARTPDKARTALSGVANVDLDALDLMNPASIDAFASHWLGRIKKLDLLVCNAAVMACPLDRDSRGYESQFSTNHLGHFQLICRLWPALVAAQGARVVIVSSLGHRITPVNFADPNFEQREYHKWKAYGQAKTANSLCALGVDQRGKAAGIRAFAVHPGGIMTDLQRSLSREEQVAMGWMTEDGVLSPVFKSVEQGAATTVWAATSPRLAGMGGVYCEDCDIAAKVPAEDTGMSGVRPWAIDPAASEQLWSLSERLTGAQIAPA